MQFSFPAPRTFLGFTLYLTFVFYPGLLATVAHTGLLDTFFFLT